MLNVINGGAHAANSIDLQEFMVVPAGAPTFGEAIRVAAEVYPSLKAVLHERGLATAVGDEGGFAPDLGSSEEAIDAILEAAERVGHRDAVAIALDPASSEFTRRRVPLRGPQRRRGDGRLLRRARRALPTVSIEDGVAEDDWDGWRQPTERLGDRVQLVGDDTVTSRACGGVPMSTWQRSHWGQPDRRSRRRRHHDMARQNAGAVSATVWRDRDTDHRRPGSRDGG
jgi:enolase